jgi:hypothetical protein
MSSTSVAQTPRGTHLFAATTRHKASPQFQSMLSDLLFHTFRSPNELGLSRLLFRRRSTSAAVSALVHAHDDVQFLGDVTDFILVHFHLVV